MTEPPAAPSGEPQERKVGPLPPIGPGFFVLSRLSWYERNANKKSIYDGDYYKWVKGLYFTTVLSASTKITLGWEHKNVLGGTGTVVMPLDNKFNFGFVANFIFPVKQETTSGNKWEKITGIKISHVVGKKRKFVGSEEVDVEDLKRDKLNEKRRLHVKAVHKIMAGLIEQELNTVIEEHNAALETINYQESTYRNLDQEVDFANQRTEKLAERAGKSREEIDNVAAKYSGPFKSLASAAHEVNCNGALEMSARGNAAFAGDSLVSLAAALTKAG
jgi:hypothetical protein